ncbi:MAG: 30S ribosomal protein S20 [Holophagaceae bacterium]
MANHKSAAKKARRDAEARLRNRANRSTLRTALKKFMAVVEAGSKTEAAAQLPGIMGVVDKAAKKGILHKNAADRHKSRLTLKVNAL